MSRSLARDCGFKRVFEYLFNKEVTENIKESLNQNSDVCFIPENSEEIAKFEAELFSENELTSEELEFSNSILSSVKQNFTDINNILLEHLKKNLQIKDIYKLDYAILLVAISEINYLNGELGVSINEAVRLAKKYSTEKSPSFINGVLSSIYGNK